MTPTFHVIFVTLSVFAATVYAQKNRGLFVRGQRPLPIDGQWNSWASWSDCYENTKEAQNFYPPLENFLIRSRNRTCDNPKPINGGKACEPPSHRFKQCLCTNPLGMTTKLIADSQITSSSYYNGYPPNQGRLGENYSGWCSKYKISYFRKSYLEIDFKRFANVGAIEIVNNKKGRTVYFKAEYSLNGKDWEKIVPKSGRKGLFKGNLIPGRITRANFSRNKVMKHLRISPTKSYGMPCLQLEAIGCVFTCGELHTSSFGQISANSRVDVDQNCLWRIEVRNTSALSFDLAIFDILCKHGYLDFRDGSYEFTNSPLIKRLCLTDRDQEVPILKINSNMVWLNFVSNSSDFEDSFTLKYFSECTQTLRLTKGESKVIKSPNYPNSYFGNMDCSWTVYAADKVSQIDLNFQDFSIESSITGSCSDDVLTIKWYRDNEEFVMGSFCNAQRPKRNYTVKADKVFIQFKTDPIQSDKGFSLSVLSGRKLTPTEDDTVGSTTPTSDISLSFENRGNNTYDGTRKKKRPNDSGSDWTVIIISAFSAIVVLLLMWVIGMNIKRFINNRNEVEAHCAKVKAKNEEKFLKEQKKAAKAEKTALIIQSTENGAIQVPVSPIPLKSPSPVNNLDNIKKEEANIEHNDGVDGECSPLMSTPSNNCDEIQSIGYDEQLNSPSAEVDSPPEYDGSVQIHSPLKTDSLPDVSMSKQGKHDSDVDSCV